MTDYTNYKTRILSYYALWLMIGGLLLFMIPVVYSLRESAIYVILFMFIPVFTFNFIFIRRITKYYLQNFIAKEDEITFIYYKKDERFEKTISYVELDFQFQSMKNDMQLHIFKNKKKQFSIRYSIADHSKRMLKLQKTSLKKIDPLKVKKSFQLSILKKGKLGAYYTHKQSSLY